MNTEDWWDNTNIWNDLPSKHRTRRMHFPGYLKLSNHNIRSHRHHLRFTPTFHNLSVRNVIAIKYNTLKNLKNRGVRRWSLHPRDSACGPVTRFCAQVRGPVDTTKSENLRIKRTKINQQNAQINSGWIYYWSITPICFGPSVEAIIREFEILESYKAIVLIC